MDKQPNHLNESQADYEESVLKMIRQNDMFRVMLIASASIVFVLIVICSLLFDKIKCLHRDIDNLNVKNYLIQKVV